MDIKHSTNTSILSQVLPNFGSTASFSSMSEDFKFGDNHTQKMLSNINAISMSLSLKFDDLTEIEAHDIVAFLQSQYYYEPQSYSNEGKFTNKRITPFNYLPFYPYKQNNFICTNFTHNKEHYNVHSVSATFQSHSASILNNVEMGAEYNSVIAGKINVSNSISPSQAESHLGFFEVSDNTVSLNKGQHVFEPNGYRNIVLTRDFNGTNGVNTNMYGFAPLGFSAGNAICQHTQYRNSIFIDTPNDCDYRPYEPSQSDGNLDARMFDFRPDSTISLPNSPKYLKSKIAAIQAKFNKYGFNPNLTNLRLQFNHRSDIEAKRILFFLESHLGYKKFAFHGLDYYNREDNDSIHTSPHRKSVSFFVCPEWSHTFVYKDNHSIQASFIECLDY